MSFMNRKECSRRYFFNISLLDYKLTPDQSSNILHTHDTGWSKTYETFEKAVTSNWIEVNTLKFNTL